MGRIYWSPEMFNCNAPDTGNMEVFHMFGTPEQKDAYLNQQQLPGDHEKLNLKGDCEKFEARPAQLPLWKRMLQRLAS